MARYSKEDFFVGDELDNLSEYSFNEEELNAFERECLLDDEKENGSESDGANKKDSAKLTPEVETVVESPKKRKKGAPKTKSKKKVCQRPNITEDQVFDKVNISQVLETIKANPLFINSESGSEFLCVMDAIIEGAKEEGFKEFEKELILRILAAFDYADKKKNGTQSNDALTENIHKLNYDTLKDTFKLIALNMCKVENDFLVNFVYGQLITEFFQIILPLKHGSKPEELLSVNYDISKEEEQIVRYVSGYIPFALLKRYKKQSNAVAKAYIKVLECLRSDSETEEDYTQMWLKIQDRGGLFTVNRNAYHLFKKMEITTKQNLKKHNISKFQCESMQELLSSEIVSDESIQNCWSVLVGGSLTGEASSKLLGIIADYFAKIRCKSFVKSIMNIRKLKKDPLLSKKFEKGLRKTLDK